MKIRKREFDIFNLSFLDVISCGFGAVIMLVLISKTNDDNLIVEKDKIESLLKTVISLENNISDIKQTIETQLSKSSQIANQQQQLEAAALQLKNKIRQQQNKQTALAEDVEGLSLVQSTLKQASIAVPETRNRKRDEEVGGIPVDSDYVIFVVDTSGSMKKIWHRVSAEIINVLNIHPKVKGFQILNDMGSSLISGYNGKWMPDTPRRRANVIKLFRKWGEMSNSSPVEGIQVALQKYAKPGITTSIYVFGDDYTGSSYDPVIDEISRQNLLAGSGKRRAKIHGIGFISPGTTGRFGVLMRELTKRNGGTFLALPI